MRADFEVGSTNSAILSAVSPPQVHGGAERFRHKYPNGNALAKKLYVAVCPFRCDVSANSPADLRIMGDVVRAEYLAFAKYVSLHRRLPEFNDKERSPKQQKL